MSETSKNSQTQDINQSFTKQNILRNKKVVVGVSALVLILLVWGFIQLLSGLTKKQPVDAPPSPENTVQISAEQAKEIKTGLVATYDFQELREAVGVIDFDRYKTADVFSPYQGRINKVLVNAGNDVKKDQVLYTVLSPDAAQASSTLLSTAGVLKQSNETLKRAKDLFEFKSVSQR